MSNYDLDGTRVGTVSGIRSGALSGTWSDRRQFCRPFSQHYSSPYSYTLLIRFITLTALLSVLWAGGGRHFGAVPRAVLGAVLGTCGIVGGLRHFCRSLCLCRPLSVHCAFCTSPPLLSTITMTDTLTDASITSTAVCA